MAKRATYHADIVVDKYAKYPLADEGIPLGRLVLNTNTELGICQGVPYTLGSGLQVDNQHH